jgi:hypothetical protein
MDNVISLSSFGEIIENPKNSVDTIVGKSDDSISDKKPESKYGKVISKVLKNTAQIKLLHWQTKSYAEHKALDKFFKSYLSISDALVESIMGKYGKQYLEEKDLSFTIGNYHDPQMDGLPTFIENFYLCYREDCRTAFDENKDSEIINLIDEILSLIDQTKYLLELK